MTTQQQRTRAVWVWLLALALAMPLAAQSRTEREKLAAQSELTAAEAALASAQAANAHTLARELYDEATARLRDARAQWNHNDRMTRERAGRRAIESRHAAAAAEAQALLVAANNDIRTIRTEITDLGGTTVAVELYEPPAVRNRGVTSLDRVIVAENALRLARAAGAERTHANDLERIEGNLKTARMLANADRQSENADHLAYVAEMEARRLEMLARRNLVAPRLADFRSERARLSQQASDAAAQAEIDRLRRQLAERELAADAAAQVEIDRLRQQLAEREAMFRAQLQEDRAARIRAEEELDDLLRAYETALAQGNTPGVELDRLRRQVDEHSATLRTLQERERLSETSFGNQISSLEQALARERTEGRLTAEALAAREEELRRQRAELDQLRLAREESERRRLEAENARAAAIAEAERRRAAAEAEAALLRQQAAQTSAALEEARSELANRDAANRERLLAMQTELSKLAQTRESDRGFIVTLPGLFFDSGKAQLKPGARNTLAKIAEHLRVNQDTTIAIEGHTDSVGSEELNQALSEKRAAAVRDYLVSRGLPATRITTTGRGESAPVANNKTPSGRQQNRRVELVISQ